MSTLSTFTLRKPDDFHLHLRDGAYLSRTVPDTARQFARAMIMPNLMDPIITVQQALAYRTRIQAQIPTAVLFEPLMTLYLSPKTQVEDLKSIQPTFGIKALKWYPRGATTHSQAGITQIEALYPVLEWMTKTGMPLLIHGEVTTPECDIFDREERFIQTVLAPLMARPQFKALKIVLEHITTCAAVHFVQAGPPTLAATITPHHLLLNRNDLLAGGLRPHHYCLPILKRSEDQKALWNAATSGHPRFFAGTDSAPHARFHKEAACGCAGIYSAHAALELYAEAFEAGGKLDKLEAFCSQFGAEFYELPLNHQKVTLQRTPWQVPAELSFGQDSLIPFRANSTLAWKLSHD